LADCFDLVLSDGETYRGGMELEMRRRNGLEKKSSARDHGYLNIVTVKGDPPRCMTDTVAH
jgi:hypothetical protein